MDNGRFHLLLAACVANAARVPRDPYRPVRNALKYRHTPLVFLCVASFLGSAPVVLLFVSVVCFREGSRFERCTRVALHVPFPLSFAFLSPGWCCSAARALGEVRLGIWWESGSSGFPLFFRRSHFYEGAAVGSELVVSARRVFVSRSWRRVNLRN